jgi:hypothetical protein
MEGAPEVRKRPDMLTILCVLTFIASTYGIFASWSKYNNAMVVAEMTEQVIGQTKEKVMENAKNAEERKLTEKMMSGANAFLDTVKVKQHALFDLMSNALTLVGAFLMFRLRRTGFGLYVLGIALFVLAPVVIYGASNLFGLSYTILLGLIGLLFVGLYALNLKHMR